MSSVPFLLRRGSRYYRKKWLIQATTQIGVGDWSKAISRKRNLMVCVLGDKLKTSCITL